MVNLNGSVSVNDELFILLVILRRVVVIYCESKVVFFL
jgi:hypothetical protein